MTISVCYSSQDSSTEINLPLGGGAGNEYLGVNIENQADSQNQTLSDDPVSIIVEPQIVIGPFRKALFGLNFDRHGLESALVDSNGKIDPAGASLLQGLSMPMSRVAGSDAMRFQWKKAIGKMTERESQQLWSWAPSKPIVIGPVEFEKWLREIDPEPITSWVLNLFMDTPQDHADLVSFLTGDTESSTKSNIWALKRVELGLDEPARVEIWELGNEVDWDEKEKWTVEKYISESKKTIAAIREVKPDAKFAAHALTAPWAPGPREFGEGNWAGWHKKVLEELGNELEYIAFHPYYYGLPTNVIETYLDTLRDDILSITGDDRIKIYISEHARWPEMPASGEWKENWHKTHSLEGCLATAQFLVRCMNRPEIVAASYHSAVDAGPWGLLYRDKETNQLYATAIVEMMRLFQKIPAGEMVSTTMQGERTDVTSDQLELVASSVKTENNLYVVIVNRGLARPANLEILDDYLLTNGWVFNGNDLEQVNTAAKRNLEIKGFSDLREKSIKSLKTIPQYSISLWQFERAN